MNDDVSLLHLLSQWCNVSVAKFTIGLNDHGYRGLLATEPVEKPGDTIILLPWQHVLGMRAARHLIDTETGKGRGMDDEEFLIRLICICDGNDQRLWSCIMACAILSGLRYPLSSWSPYIACLPHDAVRKTEAASNIEPALRRTHAWTARWQRKQNAKKAVGPYGKLSQEVLAELKKTREDIMEHARGDENALDHVLLWDKKELRGMGDSYLQELVTKDQAWLASIWEEIFVLSTQQEESDQSTEPSKDKNTSTIKQQPIVSLDSWMWAHAIVRSRAVGMDQAPQQVTSIEYDGLPFRSEGVLLPIIDLINHDSQHHNAGLEIRPEGVAVVSTKAIKKNEEILFDYHPGGTMRFFMRSYGFIDSVHQRQVFATFGGMVKLDIAVKTSTDMLHLVEVDYNQSKGYLTLTMRDSQPTLHKQEYTLDILIQLHRLAAAACEILLDDYSTPKNSADGKDMATIYKETNQRLLHRALQDFSIIASTVSSNDGEW